MNNKYSVLYPYESETRIIVDLSGTWKFKIDEKNVGESQNWKNGLKDYTTIPVPCSFNDLFTSKKIRDFAGDVYYQKEFFLNSEWINKEINIRFFSVTHKATIYLNGIQIGYHNGGFTPFVVNLNEHGKFGAKNLLVVKVNNELSWNTVPLGKTFKLSDNTKINIPSFDFFNYSGIQRPVKMLVLPKESINDINVFTDIENNNGKVKYQIFTNGNNNVKVNVYDQENNLVLSNINGKENEFVINNATFWQHGKGYLYTLEAMIVDNNNNLIDKYLLPFGIRTVKVVNNQFMINNKPFYFKGFGKHEDSDTNGHGYNPVMVKRDFELIKWVNANSFRTSHYPYSEEIYQQADKDGVVIIDEVAAVGMFDVSSVFNPSGANKKEFFKNEEVYKITKDVHKQAISELITRDKNHPCVVMYSLFNEPDTTKVECVEYFKEIFDHARKFDVHNLPKTFVMIQMSTPETCHCQDLVDVICLNRYYGWYFDFGSQIIDGIKKLDQELTAWEAKHNKPIIFTEFGCDTFSGVHKLPSVMWSEEYYVEYMNQYFATFDKHKNVIGEQLWNFADFQTVEGTMRVDGNKKGIFTRNRQPKMVAHFIRSRWGKLSNNHTK